MQIDIYKKIFKEQFDSSILRNQIEESVNLLQHVSKVFFIGNGGSNAICSHMMEDFAKIVGYQTYSFSDPALITCFSNDYGYENAIREWLKIYFEENAVLVAISSSGKSLNILNAVNQAGKISDNIITLSGFKQDNLLSKKGKINFHVNIENYGVVECFHQVILHTILDELNERR